MFMEKDTPRLEVSPVSYFHTGAIMTPGIIHGIMGTFARQYSRAHLGLLMIIYDATL